MKKRLFASLLSLVMLLALFPTVALAAGSGTSEDPYVVANVSELSEKLSSATTVSTTYIKLSDDFASDGGNNILTFPQGTDIVLIGNDQKITGSFAMQIYGSARVENLTLEPTAKNGPVTIGSATSSGTPTITFESCTIAHIPNGRPSSSDVASTIAVNCSSTFKPVVTLTNCTVTTTGHTSLTNVGGTAHTVAINVSADSGVDCARSKLVLDDTDVTAITTSPSRTYGMDIWGDGVAVEIKNGSTIAADKYYGYGITLNDKNADVTITDSTVNAWGCLVFFNSASGNEVNITGSSRLVAKTPMAMAKITTRPLFLGALTIR